MGYPYGDEYYPTFEKLESEYRFEEMKHAFYYELYRQGREAKKAFAETSRTFYIDAEDGGRYNGSIESGDYPEDATADQYGAAFSRALEYALDGDEEDMRRFFQDFFAILEDKIVSVADKERGDWAEGAYGLEHFAAIKKMLETESDNALVIAHRESYERDLEEYGRKWNEFAMAQVESLEDRLNRNADGKGVARIRLHAEFSEDPMENREDALPDARSE